MVKSIHKKDEILKINKLTKNICKSVTIQTTVILKIHSILSSISPLKIIRISSLIIKNRFARLIFIWLKLLHITTSQIVIPLMKLYYDSYKY